MKKTHKRRLIFTVLSVLFTAFIFLNSIQNAAISSAQSGNFVVFLENILSSIGISVSVSEFIIRKLAHFSEFFILGILLCLTLRTYTVKIIKNVTIPLFLGILVAVTDEFIQLFSAGRAGLVADVVLDFSGFLTGLGLAVLLVLWRDKRKKNKCTDLG
ncbi:MAG: VanZ family protein [Oscillospiraceae bacterium]|nr:VanZ family protein [Oscillospiraceae bacterium]MDD4414000.1 VanZ family protein [Oscillospiraceae bacterium]